MLTQKIKNRSEKVKLNNDILKIVTATNYDKYLHFNSSDLDLINTVMSAYFRKVLVNNTDIKVHNMRTDRQRKGLKITRLASYRKLIRRYVKRLRAHDKSPECRHKLYNMLYATTAARFALIYLNISDYTHAVSATNLTALRNETLLQLVKEREYDLLKTPTVLDKFDKDLTEKMIKELQRIADRIDKRVRQLDYNKRESVTKDTKRYNKQR